MPTTVNAQVTDTVATTAATNIAGSPSLAMGMFFQAESQAFAIGLQNAVVAQRGSHQIGEALVAAVCSLMLSAATGPAAGK